MRDSSFIDFLFVFPFLCSFREDFETWELPRAAFVKSKRSRLRSKSPRARKTMGGGCPWGNASIRLSLFLSTSRCFHCQTRKEEEATEGILCFPKTSQYQNTTPQPTVLNLCTSISGSKTPSPLWLLHHTTSSTLSTLSATTKPMTPLPQPLHQFHSHSLQPPTPRSQPASTHPK
jgi:hypothetical protein